MFLLDKEEYVLPGISLVNLMGILLDKSITVVPAYLHHSDACVSRKTQPLIHFGVFPLHLPTSP